MFFVSLQKLFSFSRKSNFRILDNQVSWRHQMPKHKTRNTFCWTTWEISSLLMKFGQFVSYYKRKNFIKKFHKNFDLETSSMPFCVYKELSTTSTGKWNLKQATYIRYTLAKLSKFFQISTQISSDSFLQRTLWKLKRSWN